MSEKNGSTSSGAKPDADALRAEIKQTRAELGETVQALAAKADVKARAKEQVEQTKQKVKAQATAGASQSGADRGGAGRSGRAGRRDPDRAREAPVSSKVQKIAYKPVGLLLSIGAGAVAGLIFKEIWKAASGDDDAPNATDEERGWGEIVAAAALQGAIFAVVKALVDRGGATGVRKLTGDWPD